MLLEFEEKGLYLAFNVIDGRLILTDIAGEKRERDREHGGQAINVQIAGRNQSGAHGGRHLYTSSNLTLRYVSHTTEQNERGTLVTFLLEDTEMRVSLHYQLFRGISAFRTWSEITAIGQEPLDLEYVSSFFYQGFHYPGEPVDYQRFVLYLPCNGWVHEVDWHRYTLAELSLARVGTPSSSRRFSVSNTGTWSAKEHLPMGAVEDELTGETLMFQIENNGSWQWEIGDSWIGDYLALSGPNDQENHWFKRLQPGETFTSVPAGVAIGTSFDNALGELTAYRRQIIRKKTADAFLPVIFNDYMNCLGANPTEENELPMIDAAAELGAEYYVMDAGWYAENSWWTAVGDWQYNHKRFPNGIRKIFDYVKSKGMVPGIWLEIEVMGIECPLAKDLPDEWFFMRHGRRVIDNGRYQLDFRCPGVRQFTREAVDRVVNEYGVGYIKFDYNIEMNAGTENDADSLGDGLLEANRAYLAWIDEIHEAYPDLILENCSSGGLRMDYAMLAHHDLQSMTDETKCTHMAAIACAAATGTLPEQAAIWAYPLETDNDNIVAMNMVNALLLRIHLSGRATLLSEQQKALVKEAVAKYKEIRGKIAGFRPFYPLGLPARGGNRFCAAYQNENETFVALWRMEDENDTVILPIEGTAAEVFYPSSLGASCTLSGGNLTVKLPEKNSAVIVRVK